MNEISPQPDLLPAPPANPETFFTQLEETTGDYTAERFRSRRPDDYKLVLALLAQGHGAQGIADTFRAQGKKLSKNTVKAIRASAGETIDTLRSRLAAEAFLAADDYRAAAVTVLNEIMESKTRRAKLTIRDVQSLEVASGIAAQNGQLLTGLPTARVVLEDLRRPDHDDFNRQLAALPAIDISAQPIDPAGQVAPDDATHLAGNAPEQKETRAGEAHAPAGPAGAPGAIAPPADSQSDGTPTTPKQNEA